MNKTFNIKELADLWERTWLSWHELRVSSVSMTCLLSLHLCNIFINIYNTRLNVSHIYHQNKMLYNKVFTVQTLQICWRFHAHKHKYSGKIWSPKSNQTKIKKWKLQTWFYWVCSWEIMKSFYRSQIISHPSKVKYCKLDTSVWYLIQCN